VNTPTKGTMLARLGDFLANHCTILYPKPASKNAHPLTREKSVLAAQRTVAACYRTIYPGKNRPCLHPDGSVFFEPGACSYEIFRIQLFGRNRYNAYSGWSLDDSGRRIVVLAGKKGAIRDAEMPSSE